MPKIIPPLTSAQVMNAKPIKGKRVTLRDGRVPGLVMNLSLTGERVWGLRAHKDGRRVWLDVGRGLGLADARTKAEEMLATLRRGEAPPQPLREAREAAKNVLTFAGVVEAYEKTDGGEKKTWKEQRLKIRSVFAALLDMPALDLSESDFLRAADAHRSRSSAESAMRYVRPLIKWASRRRYMARGVADEIQTRQTRKRRRVLDEGELHRVLNALGADGQDRAARFLLLTLARREEVAAADWKHVDLDQGTWTIPADHRKNTKANADMPPLVVPLPRQAIALLRAVAREHDTGLVFRSGKGGRLDNWTRWQGKINTASETEGWHRHDLRRTSATLAGRLGVPPHVIEIMLGHSQPHSDLAGIYNLSRYAPEHREALQKLADALDRIERGGDVVEFKSRA